MSKTTVARWEAKGGKRYIELQHDDLGYTYDGENCHGILPSLPTDYAAIYYMTRPWGQNGTGPVTVLQSDFPSVKRVL